MVGLIDLRPVRDAQQDQQRRADETAWQQADARRCRLESSEQACAGVRSYLSRFPKGLYAEDAKSLLGLPAEPPPGSAQIARPAEGQAPGSVPARPGAKGAAKPSDAALKAAQRAARRACEQACGQACQREPACKARCVEEACP
jgi:hypothetical protein